MGTCLLFLMLSLISQNNHSKQTQQFSFKAIKLQHLNIKPKKKRKNYLGHLPSTGYIQPWSCQKQFLKIAISFQEPCTPSLSCQPCAVPIFTAKKDKERLIKEIFFYIFRNLTTFEKIYIWKEKSNNFFSSFFIFYMKELL